VRRLLSTRWLFWRSAYLPRWLGIVIAVDGLGWILLITGRYVGVNLEFLFVTSVGELAVDVWPIGWGTRLSDPGREEAGGGGDGTSLIRPFASNFRRSGPCPRR